MAYFLMGHPVGVAIALLVIYSYFYYANISRVKREVKAKSSTCTHLREM